MALNEQHDDQRARRWLVKRQFFHALFFLGTLLAVIGWYIDIKGANVYRHLLLRLSVLALIGHVLQVAAGFGLLLLPDEPSGRSESNETEDDDHYD